MISLIQLEYIIAVDTWRHFATAAEKCFVTQPTLSMQIKKLETDLGITIFDRSKQPVIPTSAGVEIIRQARVVLTESNKIEEIVKSVKGQISGELKLGIIPTLAPYLLPRFTGSFLKNYSQVSLQIQELLTSQIIEALRKDKIDAGILVTPIRNEDIFARPLFYEKFILYANLQKDKRKLEYFTVNNLKETKFWLLASGHCFRNQTLNICNQEELNQNESFQFESGSLETLMKLVDAEGGATLIPELAAMDLPANKQKKLVQFGQNPVYREVSLVFSRNFVKEKLLNVMTEEIKSSVPVQMLEKEEKEIVELE